MTRRDLGQATDSAHYATPGHWGGRPKTDKRQRSRHDPKNSNAADDTQGTTRMAPQENVQQTPRHMQRATGKMQRTTRSVQQKTAGNMRHAVDDMQHVTNSVQRAACNMRQTS